MIVSIINATLNPNDISASGAVLSNNNLTAILTLLNTGNVRATHGKSIGKWYWEVKYDSGSNQCYIGVSNKNYPISSGATAGTSGDPLNLRMYLSAGYKIPENITYGTAWAVGNIIGVALDLDNGTLEFYRNGISMGISHTNLLGMGEVFPFFKSGVNTSKQITVNFGATPFSYPIPNGFKAYNGYENKILLSSGDKYYSPLNDGFQETTSIPKMKSNTTPEGEVLVSNTPNGNATFGWEAFDGGLTTSWGGNALPTTMPKWIGYKFTKPKVIVKYRLYVTNTTYYPRNYEFQGSNDGVNYDTLHSIVGGASGELDYIIPNRKSYTHYRLYITSLSTGVTLPSIMELQMFEMKPSYLVQMESATETDFLNRGAGDINDFNQILNTKKNLIKGNTVLGSGKTFEHTVDMSKRRVDKITLG
ncbi:SPRY domain-containing protein [Paenibacillus sp. FSL K6-2393]|uniref:SPRY domain-containing protein n=1 Tax=Paenibacillus sp. FSL K6-2393 TaxID=2921475 RepID=UPI0030F849B0